MALQVTSYSEHTVHQGPCPVAQPLVICVHKVIQIIPILTDRLIKMAEARVRSEEREP